MRKLTKKILPIALTLALLLTAMAAFGLQTAQAAFSTPPMISASNGHNLALRIDGTVWACGRNISGQLGDGTTTSRSIPVQVMVSPGVALSEVTAVAAGNGHSLALKDDGTVWAWGVDNGGSPANNKSNPVQVLASSGVPFTGVTAIAAGGSFSLALKGDGTVWAWGTGQYGQLGNGSTANSSYPVQVTVSAGVDLENITAITAGDRFALALKNDNTVWVWGYNGSGQIGDNTTTNRTRAVQLMSSGLALSGVTAITAGVSHSLALRNDGTVWAWGMNIYGQLGDGTITTTGGPSIPVQVLAEPGMPFTDVTDIAAGNGFSIALKGDSSVWAWGRNAGTGIFGVGVATGLLRRHPAPVMVTAGVPMTCMTAIAAGEGNNTRGRFFCVACFNLYFLFSQEHMRTVPLCSYERTVLCVLGF